MKTVLAFGIATVAACAVAVGVAYAANIVNVDQKGLAFSTAQLTVSKGDIVSFNNNDTTSHNILITGNGVSLNSGLQQPGVVYKAPMIKPGVYAVMCGIHPKMQMTITVQ